MASAQPLLSIRTSRKVSTAGIAVAPRLLLTALVIHRELTFNAEDVHVVM